MQQQKASYNNQGSQKKKSPGNNPRAFFLTETRFYFYFLKKFRIFPAT